MRTGASADPTVPDYTTFTFTGGQTLTSGNYYRIKCVYSLGGEPQTVGQSSGGTEWRYLVQRPVGLRVAE